MSAGENVATITALITIIFSTVVLGWALFYKCTDSTFKTDDLAVEKCFSFIAVPKKEQQVDNTPVANEPDTLLSGSNGIGTSLVISGVEGKMEDNVANLESMKYLRKFKETRTKITSDFLRDIAATDIYNCAQMCYDNEIIIDEEDTTENQCGGFTSELEDPTPENGRVMCRLYKKGSLSETGIVSYTTNSYKLQ